MTWRWLRRWTKRQQNGSQEAGRWKAERRQFSKNSTIYAMWFHYTGIHNLNTAQREMLMVPTCTYIVPPLLSLLYKVLTSSTMRGVVSKFKCVTPLVVDTVGYNLKLDTWPERQNTAVSQVWITIWRSHQRGMQGGMDMDRWAEGRKLHLIHPRRAGETEIDSSKMHKHPMIMHDGSWWSKLYMMLQFQYLYKSF